MKRGKEVFREIKKTGEIPETGEIIKNEKKPKGRSKNNNKQETMSKQEKNKPIETGRIYVKFEDSKRVSEKELGETIGQIENLKDYQKYIRERGGKDNLTELEREILHKRYYELKEQEPKNLSPKEAEAANKRFKEIIKEQEKPSQEDEMAKTYREYVEEKEAETEEMVQTAEANDLEKKKVEKETVEAYQEESKRYEKQTEKIQAKRAREEAKIAKEEGERTAERTKKEKEKKEFETGYTDYYFKQEGGKPEKKEGQETLDETDERIKKEERKELTPEKLTLEKVHKLVEQGKLDGEDLSGFKNLQSKVDSGEISKEYFAREVQKMFEKNKEKREQLLKERELIRMIDESERAESKENFIEEIDDDLNKLVGKEGEIEDYNEKIEGAKGLLKRGKRKELEKSKSEAEEEKAEINEKIEEILEKYNKEKGFSKLELKKLIKERKEEIKEGKEGKGEKREKEPTKEGQEEAEKKAEDVDKTMGDMEEETEEDEKDLSNDKKSILEKLKSPKGRLLLTALIAGATIACPLTSGFGIYGLLHTGLSPMGANLIAGYIGGREVIGNVRELIKSREQAKAEKE